MRPLVTYYLYFFVGLFALADENPITPCGFSVEFTTTNVACNGDSTGAVTADVQGTGTYTYRWSTGDTTSYLSSIPAQTYFLTVTNNLGCNATEFVTITEPEKLELSFNWENAICFESTTGSIDMTVEGGAGSYIYLWSDGTDSEDIQNLIAGIYDVEVRDKNDCLARDTITITEPLELTTQSSIIDVTCPGGNDGEIETFVFGGTEPYRYSWNVNSISKEVFDLEAGVYTRTVTDENGCTLTENITVDEPQEFVSSFEVKPVSCNNKKDGEVVLTMNGGTEPYSYLWSNSQIVLGEDTNYLINLDTDQYKVRVTDKKGCRYEDSVDVPQPQSLVTNINFKPVTCYGGDNGAAYFRVSGGTEPYSYLWSNDAIDPNITNITAGNYSIVVVDSNGCTETAEIEVTQPEEIIIDYEVSIVSCKDDHDGAIYTMVRGGHGNDYNYDWSNGSSTPNTDELDGGIYTLTVTDDSSCVKEASIQVGVNPVSCISIPSGFTPNDDDVNDVWIITNSELYPGLSLEVYNRWGNLVYESQQGYGAGVYWDGTYNGRELPADTYYYILNTNDGDDPLTGGISIMR